MKKCTICKKTLELTEFNKKKRNKDGLQNVCRECNREKSRLYYLHNREHHLHVMKEKKKKYIKRNIKLINRIKSKGCATCDENDICCMDFHHMDDNKEFTISKAVTGDKTSIKTILTEIQKCACICANCHRKVHAGKLKIKEKHRCIVD